MIFHSNLWKWWDAIKDASFLCHILKEFYALALMAVQWITCLIGSRPLQPLYIGYIGYVTL